MLFAELLRAPEPADRTPEERVSSPLVVVFRARSLCVDRFRRVWDSTACGFFNRQGRAVMGVKLNNLMNQLLRRLYKDEDGVVAVSDYVLLATIVAIGTIVGLVTLRDAVIQELGDVGIGLENLQQNYTVSMTFATVSGGTTTTSFGYTTDDNPTEQSSGQSTAGIDLSIPATDESATGGAVDSNG